MSEQNILNPSATSLLNFDWGYSEGLPETDSVWQAASGKDYSRLQLARGRTYELTWAKRDLATALALQQWERQYKRDFFTLVDWEKSRYFTGRFDGPLTYSPAGFNQWTIRGRFIELPGVAMFSYPTNWTRDAMFLEERNGFGEDLVKLGGTWAFNQNASYHGGSQYNTALAPSGNETAEWLYLGYGFRLWSAKNNAWGIAQVSATRVSDGSVVLAATNVDLYAASLTASAALLTKSDLPLGIYRVKIVPTLTKNASSSNFLVTADAIEVMQ